MPTDDLERFCCQNADCDLYGRRGAGNLSVCGHFGMCWFSVNGKNDRARQASR